MTRTHVPRQVFSHFNAQYQSNAVYNEDQILSELPPAMASDLCFRLYGEQISQIPLVSCKRPLFALLSEAC